MNFRDLLTCSILILSYKAEGEREFWEIKKAKFFGVHLISPSLQSLNKHVQITKTSEDVEIHNYGSDPENHVIGNNGHTFIETASTFIADSVGYFRLYDIKVSFEREIRTHGVYKYLNRELRTIMQKTLSEVESAYMFDFGQPLPGWPWDDNKADFSKTIDYNDHTIVLHKRPFHSNHTKAIVIPGCTTAFISQSSKFVKQGFEMEYVMYVWLDVRETSPELGLTMFEIEQIFDISFFRYYDKHTIIFKVPSIIRVDLQLVPPKFTVEFRPIEGCKGGKPLEQLPDIGNCYCVNCT